MTNEHKGWTGSMLATRAAETPPQPAKIKFSDLMDALPEEVRDIVLTVTSESDDPDSLYMQTKRTQEQVMKDLLLLAKTVQADEQFNARTVTDSLTAAYDKLFPEGYEKDAIFSVRELAEDHITTMQDIIDRHVPSVSKQTKIKG